MTGTIRILSDAQLNSRLTKCYLTANGADEDEDMLLLDSDRGGIQEAEDDDRDILLPEAIDVDEMLI
jgi:hypothetical protein